MSAGLHPLRRNEIREGAIDALFELPERIGRYEIQGELGRGGMGVVYDAFDRSLARAVAVKLIDEKHFKGSSCGTNGLELADEELMRRFEREMQATSSLFHPNLVAILDAGFAKVRGKTQAYYVMERIEGECLETRLRRSGPMKREDGLDVAAAVARGLTVVHAEGLVHRDLKPSNILLPTLGEAKLTDFGLCQWRPDGAEVPRERGILGSPHYLAPEQVTHGDVNFKADLFSLGAVIVHIFSGAPPFPASSLSEHFDRIVSDEPDGLGLLERDVRAFVRRLLSKNPADRPESTEAVARQLEELGRCSRGRGRFGSALRRAAVATGVGACAAISLGVWVQQDLAQVRAEVQLREQELAIQLGRAQVFAPILGSWSESAKAGATGEQGELRDEAAGTLNRITVARRRYAEAASHLSARLDALPWSLLAPLLEVRHAASPSELERKLGGGALVHDPQAYLDAREFLEVEQQLRLLRDELGVEARVIFVAPPSQQSFEEFGIAAFDALTARGFGPGARGLLLLVDGESRRARVEVGYRLEPFLSDALVGALARQHLASSADAEQRALDLRLVLRIVRQRLRNAILAGTFNLVEARAEAHETGSRYGAGGGGASATARIDPLELAPALHPEARAHYGPAATVREVYDRYLAWLRQGDFDPGVGLFTPESQEILSSWRGAQVYLAQMSKSPQSTVDIVVRDNRAMLYPLSNPLAPPHFFRRDEAGWRIDLASRKQHVIHIAGGSFSWTLRGINALPLAKFQDLLEVVDGLIRIRGGDNRTLATAQGTARGARS